jgi:AcrR family transcriptional regulator
MLRRMATPDRRRLAPERRTEQLLDAALTLAAGGDLAALSVEDIAREAGVSVGLLYHYFPTKQALVTAAVRRAAAAFVDDLRAAPADWAPTSTTSRPSPSGGGPSWPPPAAS